jgi:CheY-like chemotaxis protein
MTVLIVEDDFLVSLAVSRMIGDLGHVVAARLRSAEAAYAFLERERPDLVLMDIRLDGPTDGIEAATVIRERWGLPFAFLSAFGDRRTLERAKAAMPLAFLDKPVALDSLRSLLDAELPQKLP